MISLRERAQSFLNRSIPEELSNHYVPGSMAELFIRHYASNGSLDEESAELIGICAFECDAAAGKYKTSEAKEYFAECASILAAIEGEEPT